MVGAVRAVRNISLLAVVGAAVLAGCGGPQVVHPGHAVVSSDLSDRTTQAVQGRIIVLDPGHNGGNASHAAEINKQVADGRGGTKACNTTGTATNAGYTEHAFTFDVAQRVAALLREKSVQVVMTRDNDTGVGPCVDVRGKAAERAGAEAMVSIHADGSSPGGRGFHVAYPSPPVNAAQGAPSLALATALRDGMRDSGLPLSTYLGKQGLAARSDLAGLNLATRPVALVECANMRNAAEAALVSSADGRQRYAQAIAAGILRWLEQTPRS